MSEGRQAIARLLEGITAFFLLLAAVLRPLATGELLGFDGAMSLGGTIYVSLPTWFAVVSWLLRGVAAGRLRLFRAGGDVFLILLVLLVLLSPRPTTDRNLALPAAMVWATNVLYLYLVVNVGREARFSRWLLAALLSTAVAIGAQGLIQATVDLPELKRRMEQDPEYLRGQTDPETVQELRDRAKSARPYGPFVNENSLAGLLSLALFPLLGLLLDAPRGNWRQSVRGLLLIGFLALLVLTRSKGGAIGLAVGLGAFLWVGRVGWFARRAFRWTCASAGLAAVLALVVLSWTRLDPLGVHQRYSSAWYRIGYWTGAVRVFLDHPWAGVGLDNFQAHYYEVKDADAQEVRLAHCDYLQVAADLGVFGLVGFLGFWASVLLGCSRAREPSPDGPPEGPIFLRLSAIVIAGLGAAALGPVVAEGLIDGRLLFCLPYPPSAFLLSGAWLIGFIALRPAPRQAASPWVRAGVLAGLCAALAHAAVDNHFYIHGLSFVIWALAGVVIVLFQEARGQEPILDVNLGRGGAALTLGLAAAFSAVILLAVVPVMKKAQEEAEIYRSAREKGTQPDYFKASHVAPWDPRPLFDLASFRHSACRMMTREKLQEQSGGVDRPLTVDSTRHLPDLWRVCLPYLEDAIKLAPRDRALRYWLGRFHEEHADRALEIAAQEEGPQRMALDRHAAGALEEALKAYLESYRLYPTRPENAWRVGRVLERLGRAPDARPYLEKALALHRLQILDRLKLPEEVVEDLERRFGGR